MNLDRIILNFNMRNSYSVRTEGMKIFVRGSVIKLDFLEDKKNYEIKIKSSVISEENSNESYNNHIILDSFSGSVDYTECECESYRKNSYYSQEYFCKHLAATMLEFIKRQEYIDKSLDKDYLKELIKTVDSEEQLGNIVNLKPIIYKNECRGDGYLTIEFKIGTDKLYYIKNIMNFIEARRSGETIVYGKNFKYNPIVDRFSSEDEEVVKFLDELVSIYEFMSISNKPRAIKGKEVNIPSRLINKFLSLYKNRSVLFNAREMFVSEELPLNISINEGEEGYELEHRGDIPIEIAINSNVYLDKNKLYIINQKQSRFIRGTLDIFKGERKVKVKKNYGKDLFNKLIPRLKEASKGVEIGEEVRGYMVKHPLVSKFYLDIKDGEVILKDELIYGEEKITLCNNNDNSIILRDFQRENRIKKILDDFNMVQKDEYFVFNGSEDKLYDFLTFGYKELEEIGQFFYSDIFKEKTSVKTPRINSAITRDSDDYLNISFEIEQVNDEEYKSILKSIKNNRKFYRMKDGNFLSLEENKTKEIFTMIDHLGKGFNNISKIKVPSNRAFLIDKYLESGVLSFIKGREHIKEITDKMDSLESLEFNPPEGFKASLRDYQQTGYKWFKIMSYLGFGGILADEMGLGKTVQSIGFLLSEREGVHLIVAPTALVYNWKNEFIKFAPSMKVGVAHGLKKEREEVLDNIQYYDVILTTYGTLKNDIERYKDISFNVCIIDEGQNIKNSLAQGTRVVKKIKSRVKFALTGTPIENNIFELWSIFDFVMPGFLSTQADFKSNFLGEEDGIKKLQDYIKPFILRRLKKDVLLELPDKIEKKHYIELSKEQKKIYQSYVENIRSLMENESFEGDKITILSYLTKLRQLCLHPELIVENYKGGSGKIDMAIEVIKERIENGEKILLFSQFTSMLNIISRELKNCKVDYSYIDGGVSAKKRAELVDEFNASKDGRVFLISLKAGGTGLNLTSANTVIHFDPWWNPAVEEQATDRSHRMGQKKIVEVLKLIAEGTIEDKIINLQEEKKGLINDVMSGDYNGGNIISSLSKNEILKLL